VTGLDTNTTRKVLRRDCEQFTGGLIIYTVSVTLPSIDMNTFEPQSLDEILDFATKLARKAGQVMNTV